MYICYCDMCKEMILPPDKRITFKVVHDGDFEETMDLHERCFQALVKQSLKYLNEEEFTTKLP